MYSCRREQQMHCPFRFISAFSFHFFDPGIMCREITQALFPNDMAAHETSNSILMENDYLTLMFAAARG